MLTLTRKVGEIIHVGDGIVVVVKEIRRNHVRIGIQAPRELKIYRGEIYRDIQEHGFRSEARK
jgi:carbon storage regulator